MDEDQELNKILEKRLKTTIEEPTKPYNPEVLNVNNFDRVINGTKPVIVDFYADWCAPCRSMSPIFEKMSTVYNKMVFARLNVDENGEIARRYNVFSIPTFIVFSQGKPMDILIGGVGEKGLERFIIKNLSS